MKIPAVLILGAFLVPSLASCLHLPTGSASCPHPDCAAQQAQGAEAASATRDDPGAPGPWASRDEEPTVLYARDGTPVEHGPSQASAPVGPGPLNTRAIDDPESGRLYLLELYQQAVDDRDALVTEVTHQETLLLEMRSSNTMLEGELAAAQERVRQLEADKLRAEDQAFELASRVAVAQIGRLESELRRLQAEKAHMDAGQQAGARSRGVDPESAGTLEPPADARAADRRRRGGSE